jgi:hypothetical protein
MDWLGYFFGGLPDALREFWQELKKILKGIG